MSSRKPSLAERDAVVARLRENFVDSTLDLGEFEDRLHLAERATDYASLMALVADLPAPATAPQPPPTPQALVPPRPVPLLSILGSVSRSLAALPQGQKSITVFGNTEFDISRATLPAGPSDLHVVVVFGNFELTVPPDMYVEVASVQVLANAEDHHNPARPSDPSTPWLRIRGAVVFGNLEVTRRR